MMDDRDSCCAQPSRAAFVAAITSLAALAAAPAAAVAAAPTAPIVSPATALRRLEAGNARFVAGNMSNADHFTRRAALAASQAPFATILSCSDSRVATEVIFDQSLGDLFIVRIAGNFIEPGGLATMEYGYSVLNSHLIVVLGHEGCGAVKATYDAVKTGKNLPPHLDTIQEGIAPAITSIVKASGSLEACITANAKYQAAQLPVQSSVLGAGVGKNALKIVAATYQLKSGAVTFAS